MSLKLVFAAVTGEYDQAFKAMVRPIARAATRTIDDAKTELLTGGRAAIGAGGFGPKWQNALRVIRYPLRGESVDAAAWLYHKIPYAGVFQTGARIAGKPLLWLPLPTTPRSGGRAMTPATYIATVGPLHVINVPGKAPMLAGYMRGRPGAKPTLAALHAGSALGRLGVGAGRSASGRSGLISVPLFFGVSSVTLRKRFDLEPVYQRTRGHLAGNYLRHIAEENR